MKLIPEWKDHSYCLIAWPCNLDLYGSQINKAKIEIASLANQISEEEKVNMYCNSADYRECTTLISNKSISIIMFQVVCITVPYIIFISMIVTDKHFLSSSKYP